MHTTLTTEHNLFASGSTMTGDDIYTAIATARRNPRISDVHLIVGETPAWRLDGDIIRAASAGQRVTSTAINEFVGFLQLDQATENALMQEDGSYTVVHRSPAYPEVGRIRATVYRAMKQDALAIRLLGDAPPKLEDLSLPTVFGRIAENNRGLALICGPTGVGKTTAMNAVIDRINAERSKMVLILEEFQEYVHTSAKAAVTVIQVGRGGDAPTYEKALDTSLRNDADIVVIAEARTPAAIMAALVAADLGKRVIMGVHIDSVTRFADRIVGAFEASQQNMVRTLLAAHVQEVTYTVLPKRIKPTARFGRIPACEILTRRDGLVEAIAGTDTAITTEAAIKNYIINGKNDGDILLEDYLAQLCREMQLISAEEAKDVALRDDAMKRLLEHNATAPASGTRWK